MEQERGRHSFRRTVALVFVILSLCSQTLSVLAADPDYSAQLDVLLPTAPPASAFSRNGPSKVPPEIAAFEEGLTSQVQAMARGPEISGEPPPTYSVAWACVAAAALAL